MINIITTCLPFSSHHNSHFLFLTNDYLLINESSLEKIVKKMWLWLAWLTRMKCELLCTISWASIPDYCGLKENKSELNLIYIWILNTVWREIFALAPLYFPLIILHLQWGWKLQVTFFFSTIRAIFNNQYWVAMALCTLLIYVWGSIKKFIDFCNSFWELIHMIKLT